MEKTVKWVGARKGDVGEKGRKLYVWRKRAWKIRIIVKENTGEKNAKKNRRGKGRRKDRKGSKWRGKKGGRGDKAKYENKLTEEGGWKRPRSRGRSSRKRKKRGRALSKDKSEVKWRKRRSERGSCCGRRLTASLVAITLSFLRVIWPQDQVSYSSNLSCWDLNCWEKNPSMNIFLFFFFLEHFLKTLFTHIKDYIKRNYAACRSSWTVIFHQHKISKHTSYIHKDTIYVMICLLFCIK